MKPSFRRPLSCLSFIALAATTSAQEVTLIQNDGVGQSSWAFGGRWSDGLIPSATKHYVVNGSPEVRRLRTADNVAGTPFAGGSLTITNSGELFLKTANNSTNTVFDLRVDNNGLVTVVDNGRTITLEGNLNVLAGGGRLSATTNANFTLSSTVTGSGPITKLGAGTLRLNGNLSGYSGTLTAEAGTVRLNSPFGGNLAAAANSTLAGEQPVSGNITLTNATLAINAASPESLAIQGNLTLNDLNTISLADGVPTSAGTFTVLTYAGSLNGSPENLELANSSHYRDPLIHTATPNIITISLDSESRTWTGENNGSWDINATENWLEGDKRFRQMDAVHFGDDGAGDITLTGALTPTAITVNSSENYNFIATGANLIAGPTSLHKTGTGTLTLGGANTFHGGITVAQGTLRAGSASQSFGANGQIITIAPGATLDFNDSNSANRDFECHAAGAGVDGMGAIVNNAGTGRTFGIGSLTLTGDATIGGLAQWDIRPIAAATKPAALNLGGFSLTKTGPNNLNLADITISQDGPIHLNEGTLSFSRGQVGGAGTIHVNPGTALRFVNYSSGSFSKPIQLANNSTLHNAGANLTLGSTIALTGDTTLSAANNTLIFSHPFTGTGQITKIGPGTVILPAPLQHSGTLTLTEGMLSLACNEPTNHLDMLARNVTGTQASTLAFGGAGSNPLAVYTVSNGGNFQGNFRVLSGVFQINSTQDLGSLALDAENQPLPKSITLIARDGGVHLNGSSADITLPPGYNFTISNDVMEVPAIANLAGDNTIQGEIGVSIGGGGGTVSVVGGSLTLAGNIYNVSTTRSLMLGGTGGSGTISGVISNGSNPLGVEKHGPNTWTLTGENSYTGTTTIFAGTLRVGDGGNSGSLGTGSIVNNGTLVIHRGGVGEFTIPGAISGTGNLSHTGSGFTILSSDSSYTGNTHISNGTLSPSYPSFDDNSTILISGTGILDLFHAQTDTVKSLVIDGTPQPAGTWGGIGSGAQFETPRITSNGILNVTTSGATATPYEEWTANFPGLSNPDPNLDFDGGGFSTALEWVLGGNPANALDDASLTPSFDNTSDPDFFLFTYRRSQQAAADPNTTIQVEYGGNLTDWTVALAGPDVQILVDPNAAVPGIDLVQVKIRRTLATQNRIFARLKAVVANP